MSFLTLFSIMLRHASKRGSCFIGKAVLCLIPVFLIGCTSLNSENPSSSLALKVQGLSHLNDERGNRTSSKANKTKKNDRTAEIDIATPKITQQALATVIEAPEEPEVIAAPDVKQANLKDVKFVDKTDPKFDEVKPQINSRTLKGVYAKIANAALNSKKFSREALLRASEHKLEAHKQNLLPQVTPGVSIDSDGDTIAQLQVEQVLFDGGRYKAGKDILNGEKATAAANLRTNENERINKAISAYIEYHHARSSQAMLSKTIKSFRHLEKQSESRIYNGVGDASDRDLFQLKKLEVESEYETQEGVALSRNQEFRALTGMTMPSQPPQSMNVSVAGIDSPLVALANAERDTVLGNLELQKSNQLPRVSLNGNVGTATDSFDTQNMDVRLDVSLSQPLTWGFDHSVAATQSEVEASNRKYDEILKDTQDQVKTLKFDIIQARSRHKRLIKLSANAEKRLQGFNSQFLAGQAGIAEASSTIESYKKIKINAIDTEFSIYQTELELATLTGVLSQH